MRTSVKSGISVQGTLPAPYKYLTKKELVELFTQHLTEPLTPREFTRCAIAVVSRWCDNVITGGFASVHSVKDQLSSLEKLYKNR